jgi:hypothetical protein
MHTPTDDQRRRFEQLCMLRSLYALRGSADAESVMDVASAIRYGEALLRDAAGGTVRAQPGDSAI